MNKGEIICIPVLALGVEWCMICEGSAIYNHIIPLRWPNDSDNGAKSTTTRTVLQLKQKADKDRTIPNNTYF